MFLLFYIQSKNTNLHLFPLEKNSPNFSRKKKLKNSSIQVLVNNILNFLRWKKIKIFAKSFEKIYIRSKITIRQIFREKKKSKNSSTQLIINNILNFPRWKKIKLFAKFFEKKTYILLQNFRKFIINNILNFSRLKKIKLFAKSFEKNLYSIQKYRSLFSKIFEKKKIKKFLYPTYY